MSLADLRSESGVELGWFDVVRRMPGTIVNLGLAAYERKRNLLIAVAAVIGVALVALRWQAGGAVADSSLIYQPVTRGVLPITVVERGNLESQHDLEILCEVDDVRNDGINGTPIVWIIPNGSSVQEGDLLVELDSTALREELDEQVLDTERARAEKIRAESQLENQRTQNETIRANAALDVKLAELELEMFVDQQNGTHKLEVEEIKRAIDDLNNEILAAQASLELKKNEKEGIESLFKLGYAGKSELDRSRLELLQAESQYVAKMNRLQTQLATLEKKQTYERQMELLKLQGAVETAKRNLEQVVRDNEAKLAQVQAAAISAAEQLKKEEERLKRFQDQLAKCKIYAPQEGMVAYASERGSEIREGAPVRPRQKILSLPNLRKMQVKTSVHESVLDQIASGLPATIRVDAFPNRVYKGNVKSVAVLPDQNGWLSSDTKVYETIVTIDDQVEQLKPGMTAVVEIHIDSLQNVLKVPVQAVVQRNNRNWCYVNQSGSVIRRPIELGRTNDKFVEIRSGLGEGEQVVLNPMSLSDSAENLQQDGSHDAAESQPTEQQAASSDSTGDSVG